jgi:2-iminobutanoate/2-iminopropanoate deaminase
MGEPVASDAAPKAIGPYSQAIRAGEFVFSSGQVGLDASTGELVGGGIEAQTARAIQNLEGVLKAAGLDLTHVVKTTVFLISMDDFTAMNEAYGKFFADQPPARSTVAVKTLPKGALVEIEAIAWKSTAR